MANRTDHISRILGIDATVEDVDAEAKAAPLFSPEQVDYLKKVFPNPSLVSLVANAESGEQVFAHLGQAIGRETVINHIAAIVDAQRHR